MNESERVAYDNDSGTLSITLTRSQVLETYCERAAIWLHKPEGAPPAPYDVIDEVVAEIALATFAVSWRVDAFARKTRAAGDHYLGPRGHYGARALLEINKDDVLGDSVYAYVITTPHTKPWLTKLHGDFFHPVHPDWGPETLSYRSRPKKRTQNHEIGVENTSLFPLSTKHRSELVELSRNCPCPLSALDAHAALYSAALQYSCTLCGKAYVCECFRGVENAIRKETNDRRNQSSFARLSSEWSWRADICHLCRKTSSNERFMHPMYGSSVMVAYAPWIYRDALLSASDEPRLGSPQLRAAENGVRERLGIPRIGEGWVNETLLFKFVENWAAGRFEVIHHARPKHLGGLEYDVYVPALRLAIEYDGAQHHQPIEHFGGEEALVRTKERDKRKNLCARRAGVLLLRLREGYSEAKLVKRLESRAIDGEKDE